MKIAFDFHGVLEEYPEHFKPLLISLYRDHEVIILSGPPIDQIYSELNDYGYQMGIHFDYAVSVVDWIKANNTPMYLNSKNEWECDEENWWSSKSKICNEMKIEMMWDDQIRYQHYIRNNNPVFIHVK